MIQLKSIEKKVYKERKKTVALTNVKMYQLETLVAKNRLGFG